MFLRYKKWYFCWFDEHRMVAFLYGRLTTRKSEHIKSSLQWLNANAWPMKFYENPFRVDRKSQDWLMISEEIFPGELMTGREKTDGGKWHNFMIRWTLSSHLPNHTISIDGQKRFQFTLKSIGKSIEVIWLSSNSSFANDIFEFFLTVLLWFFCPFFALWFGNVFNYLINF